MKDFFKKTLDFVKANKLNVVFLVFVILQTILAGHFWLWTLLSFIPPLFYSCFFAILIVWNFIKNNYYGFLLLLLMTPFVFYNSDVNLKLTSNNNSSGSTKVKIFDWNTEFWEDNDKEGFYKFLKSQDADVYHLQEHLVLQKDGTVVSRDDLDEIRNQFKDYKVIAKTEFVTITRLPVVESFEKSDSNFLRVDMQVKNNVVSFYNVHVPVQIDPNLLNSPLDLLNDMKIRFDERETAYTKLQKDLELNKNEFIISGDFNSTKAMGKIHPLLEYANDGISASNILFPATWSVRASTLWRIDYILTYKGLNIASYNEISKPEYSDHKALVSEIEL